MGKIQMQTPLVEMDGDEMTRILWQLIKDELLLPFIDLKTEYYDLGLEYRNETDDQVTIDAAEATKKYGVAVKCATITPNKARMSEYNLKKMYKSPNGTIRAILDGTVFRAPIVVKGIEPCVKNWKKPITIARHAYGDVYKNTEMYIDGPGDAYLLFKGENGEEKKELIHHYDSAGVLQGMHNLDDSISSFARCCFNYALDTKQSIWFGGKDTISKIYDGRFKEIFATIYENEFKALGVQTVIATADGGRGTRGFVTDALPERFDTVCACGPMPMLKALCAKTDKPGQISLEARMGCGFGACMGCTIDTVNGPKRVCREGPVFGREEIKW